MTAPTPPRPLDVRLRPDDAVILHRALRMLAQADGHLDPAGHLIVRPGGRRT